MGACERRSLICRSAGRCRLKLEALMFILAGLQDQRLIDVDLGAGRLRWPDGQ
jgi:hypothetical protein